ncbi:hypothetical protein ACFZAG_16060 [Streptomyces sp. NPDC012403]|uniref:hypothetical protein n=1 Tax=unclassified Streptomyces TaxID=2593676 RepID=UPI001C229026|nr:hypothetical protein [Streptomyces sp. AC558_RSS880]
MHDLIRRIVRWLGLLIGPGTGTHRVGDFRPTYATVRPTDFARLPLHRSPYCLHPPLDGAESRLVRPYLVAQEAERARQWRRRGTLVPTVGFGSDFDQHVLGAERAAA